MLSPDTEFGSKGTGNVTGNDWFSNHTYYRRLILEGRHAGTKSILRIIRQWNENVFPAANNPGGEIIPDSEEEREAERQRIRSRDDGGRGGVQGLLERMSLDEIDSDSGDSTAAAALGPVTDNATTEVNPATSTRSNSIVDTDEASDNLSNGPDDNVVGIRLAAQPTVTVLSSRRVSSARSAISSRPAVSALGRPAIAPEPVTVPDLADSTSTIVPGPGPADPPPAFIAPRRRVPIRNKTGAVVSTINAIDDTLVAGAAGPSPPPAAAVRGRGGKKKSTVGQK